MKREELIKLEGRLKLMGYSCIMESSFVTRNWEKIIGKAPGLSARLIFHVWVNEDPRTSKESINVQASAVIAAERNGYKFKTEFSSTDNLDPSRIEKEAIMLINYFKHLNT